MLATLKSLQISSFRLQVFVLQKYWPAFGFFFLLIYQWRIVNLGDHIPAYGDALEVIWGLNWFADHFPRSGWMFYPQAFYPFGWHITTFAFSPTFFMMLLPLVKMGGAAFAYNITALLGAVICFTGMYRLSYETIKTRGVAFAAAILCTFWPVYWIRSYGQLNLHLSFALLPWLAWGLHRLDRYPSQKRWPLLIGIIWGLLCLISLYGLWLGIVVVGVWLVSRWWQGQKSGRVFLTQGFTIALTAALVALPNLLLYLYGSRQAQITPFAVDHAVYWGGSLNNLFIPFPQQTWLAPLRQWLYQAPDTEASTTWLGLLTGCLGIGGVILSRRRPQYRPFALLFLAGMVLSLGYLLRWNEEFVSLPALEPLNRWLWHIGHSLKPTAFLQAEPPEVFANGIPLPGYLPAIFVPFWENARTLSRFIGIAAVGLFPMVALFLSRLPRLWALLLGLYLISQVLWPTSGGVPVTFAPHPAYEWLNDAAAPPGPILEINSPVPDHLALEITPPVIWGTTIHQHPTITGTSSSWPAHVHFLHTWLLLTPYDSTNPLFTHLIRNYGTRLILFHNNSSQAGEMLATLKNDNRFHLLHCFEGPPRPSPWSYPICIFELTEPVNPAFNVLTAQPAGWFEMESWGVWANGTRATGTFTVLEQQDQRLSLELIPHCVPGEPQSIIIQVGETILAEHQWADCTPWQADLLIPAALVRPGLNDITFEAKRAWRPVEVTEGANPDARLLGFAAATLHIEPVTQP